MNDAQKQVAEAYSLVFSPSAHTQVVMDDLTVFVNGLGETQQPGGYRVLAYILLKRSALRREKARSGK